MTEAAQPLGVSRHRVESASRRWELVAASRPPAVSPEQLERLVAEGYSARAIATDLGVHLNTVRVALHRQGRSIRPRVVAAPNSERLRTLLGQGLSFRAAATELAVTKRDTDLALADVDGITGVLVRPPAILGAAPTSVWNTPRPADLRDDPEQRRTNPARSFAWVHVDDLAALVASPPRTP